MASRVPAGIVLVPGLLHLPGYLDGAAQARFSSLCRERQRSGGIVIAATHQPLDLDAPVALRLEAIAPDAFASSAPGEPGSWDEIG